MSATIVEGVIVNFNRKRGEGFIAPDDCGDEVAFHVKDTRDSDLIAPKPGQRVAFERALTRDRAACAPMQ